MARPVFPKRLVSAPRDASTAAAAAAPPGPPAPAPAAAPPRDEPQPRQRRMRIVAQDPSVRVGGRILTATVNVPAEALAPGPRGYRVHVVDYDASSGHFYAPLELGPGPGPGGPGQVARAWPEDPAAEVPDATVQGDPRFHAQNVYALVMLTLARFEHALGRRVSWGFPAGHQIKVAPHAFADANAFYSRRDEALLFGHFPSRDGERTVFTCLSHDVVVHEATHAVLDGLRTRFTEPSSPDQAAFHEGFADVVALLSVFALPEVVRPLLDRRLGEARAGGGVTRRLRPEEVSREALSRSVLLGLAEELGAEMGAVGRSALRHSAELPRSPIWLGLRAYQEPHRRGEILVAAVVDAFVSVWAGRLAPLAALDGGVDRERAAEEGSAVAEQLLTMAIRALDYCPPVHLEFGTYLSAMLTADAEVRPTDDRYHLRAHLRESFGAFGIGHAARAADGGPRDDPTWQRAPAGLFQYDRTRFEPMQRDPDEVFRFAWENRSALRLHEGAYTRVLSVRPCLRLAPEDGFTLRETVAELHQQLSVTAGELGRYGIARPAGMADEQEVTLLGGVTLVFDEYGRVKYAIGDGVFDPSRPGVQARQGARLASLWERGLARGGPSAARRFAALHRDRSVDAVTLAEERW